MTRDGNDELLDRIANLSHEAYELATRGIPTDPVLPADPDVMQQVHDFVEEIERNTPVVYCAPDRETIIREAANRAGLNINIHPTDVCKPGEAYVQLPPITPNR